MWTLSGTFLFPSDRKILGEERKGLTSPDLMVYRGAMYEKAREVKDPLSHNPVVYYRQAQYFHSKLDNTNALFYLSLAWDANNKEDGPNIGSLIMAKQAQSLARVPSVSHFSLICLTKARRFPSVPQGSRGRPQTGPRQSGGNLNQGGVSLQQL